MIISLDSLDCTLAKGFIILIARSPFLNFLTMPSSRTTCNSCNAAITPIRSPGVQCSGDCQRWFHFDCVIPELSPETISAIHRGDAEWTCMQCSVGKRRSTSSGGPRSVEGLLNMLEALTLRVAVLESTSSELCDRVIQLGAAELEQKRTITGLLAENSNLSHRVAVLESGLLRLEGSGMGPHEDPLRRIDALIDRHSISKISGEVSFRDAIPAPSDYRDISPIRRIPPPQGNVSPRRNREHLNKGRDELTSSSIRGGVYDIPGPSGNTRSGAPDAVDNPGPVPNLSDPPDNRPSGQRNRPKKRQKRRKRELILGSAETSDTEDALRAAPVRQEALPPDLVWVYVTHVHKEATEEILREHVRKLGVASCYVVRVNLFQNHSGDASYSAFRVGVFRDCEQSLLRREAWPSGVRVGRWFFRRKPPSTH